MQIQHHLTFPYGIYTSEGDIDGFLALFKDGKGVERFYTCFQTMYENTPKEFFFYGTFQACEGGFLLKYFSTNGSWWLSGSRYGMVEVTQKNVGEHVQLQFDKGTFTRAPEQNWEAIEQQLLESMSDKGLV